MAACAGAVGPRAFPPERGRVFLKGVGKFIKKLKPLKFLGKVAGSLTGIGSALESVSGAIGSAKSAIAQRKLAGEAPAQAYIGGLSDAVHPAEAAVRSNAVPILLIAGAALIVFLMLRK